MEKNSSKQNNLQTAELGGKDPRCRIKVGFRLTFSGEEKFFGPGIARLLELIDEYGSIRTACAVMEMSYSKAWKILKRADRELGFPLLDSKNGGDKGGQSSLTDEGRAFLNNYIEMQKELEVESEKLMKKYFGE